MATQYDQASDTCMANRPNMRGNPTAHRTQPSLPASHALAPCARQPVFRARHTTSPSFRSKVYAALVKTCARRNTAHLHPLCAQRTSLRASDSPDKTQHQLSPPKLRIPIPCYTSYKSISPSYTPLPGLMTALALRTSLILVVEFHAVCRCTICCAQVNSEARIPGITMTVRVDIFTKTVTSNPQINQPKFANQLCDSHPDLMSLPADSSCEGRVSLHFTQSGLSIPTLGHILWPRPGSDHAGHCHREFAFGPLMHGRSTMAPLETYSYER